VRRRRSSALHALPFCLLLLVEAATLQRSSAGATLGPHTVAAGGIALSPPLSAIDVTIINNSSSTAIRCGRRPGSSAATGARSRARSTTTTTTGTVVSPWSTSGRDVVLRPPLGSVLMSIVRDHSTTVVGSAGRPSGSRASGAGRRGGCGSSSSGRCLGGIGRCGGLGSCGGVGSAGGSRGSSRCGRTSRSTTRLRNGTRTASYRSKGGLADLLSNRGGFDVCGGTLGLVQFPKELEDRTKERKEERLAHVHIHVYPHSFLQDGGEVGSKQCTQ